MSDRVVRTIFSDGFPFDISFFWQSDDKFVVRLLNEAPDSRVSEDADVFKFSRLETTDVLSTPFASQNLKNTIKTVYQHENGKNYYIVAEQILDTTKRQWGKVWQPNANFIFHISMWGDKVLRVDEKRGFTYFTKWRSNWFADNEGWVVPAQIYLWQPSDTISVMSKSLVAKPNGLITNVPLTNVINVTPESIHDDETASQRLEIGHWLTGPETVEPDGVATFTVRTHDWYQNPVSINYDNYVVEPVDGYAPHRRFSVKDGIGTFDVIALGLKDGEEMRVKFGTRNQTGIRECVVKVKSSES